ELAVRHLRQMRPRHLALTRCPRNNGVLEEGLTAAEAGSLACCSGGRCGSIDEVSCSCRSGQAYSTIYSPPFDAFMLDYALPEPSLSWRGAFGTRQGSGYRMSC